MPRCDVPPIHLQNSKVNIDNTLSFLQYLNVCLIQYHMNIHMATKGVVSLCLEEQLSKFPIELLDCQCFESHLSKLVHHITTDTMVLLATDLGLSDVEINDIQEIWPRNPVKQRLEMLRSGNKRAYYKPHIGGCLTYDIVAQGSRKQIVSGEAIQPIVKVIVTIQQLQGATVCAGGGCKPYWAKFKSEVCKMAFLLPFF